MFDVVASLPTGLDDFVRRLTLPGGRFASFTVLRIGDPLQLRAEDVFAPSDDQADAEGLILVRITFVTWSETFETGLGNGGAEPAEDSQATYSVQPGDTLNSIAEQFGLTLPELLVLNPELEETSALGIGDVIVVADEAFIEARRLQITPDSGNFLFVVSEMTNALQDVPIEPADIMGSFFIGNEVGRDEFGTELLGIEQFALDVFRITLADVIQPGRAGSGLIVFDLSRDAPGNVLVSEEYRVVVPLL